MSSCFICEVGFDLPEHLPFGYNENFQKNGPGFGPKYHHCVDVLNGTGFFFNDTQHDNTQNVNYFTYRIKRIEVRGSLNIKTIKPPAIYLFDRYENYYVLMKGSLSPGTHAWGDYSCNRNISNFRYYKEPENVLGSYLQPSLYTLNIFRTNEFYITCNKTFYIGPNEGIYMDYLLPIGNNDIYTSLSVYATAKIWYDVI